MNVKIEKIGSDGEHLFHLYVTPKDEHAETWEGPRSGVEGAYEVFGADHVRKYTLGEEITLILIYK